jgi:hypothetical protein
MRTFINALREVWAGSRKTALPRAACAAVLSVICIMAPGQTPAPEQTAPASPAPSSPAQAMPEPAATSPAQETQPASTPSAPATQSESHAPNNLVLTQGAFRIQTAGGEIKEDQLKQMLVGKTLYLRAGYQDNTLEFDEKGQLLSHSPKGSFTLSQIQINKVKLSKHKIQLEGDRYALHFLGAAPYEDPTKATDRVKINPKKKSVRISFERQEVEKPKKKDKSEKHKHHAKSSDAEKETAARQPSPENTVDAATPASANLASATLASAPTPAPADHPSDKKGTLAASQAQASQLLLRALDTVFSVGIDERMIAAMPEFWKLYYQAAAAKTDYTPTDPGVLRQNAVDQKARLISAVDPPSNEFAQANGVAGIALYHAVIDSDGKVEEVVAGRPIGFGLDESAEQTIRKANFQPATKDGKPVPVALDVVVSFRIYSKRTSQPGAPDRSQKPSLPGPYTVETTAASPATPPPATPPQ